MENNTRFEIGFSDNRPSYAIARLLRLVLFVGLLGSGSLWIWGNYSVTMIEQNTLPIFKASHMPMKIKPISPGGMKFPYQDLSVYCRISEC